MRLWLHLLLQAETVRLYVPLQAKAMWLYLLLQAAETV
jgi:hypothetical protein